MRKVDPRIFTEKNVDMALAILKGMILHQMIVKGNEAFYSLKEGLGAVTEEYHEVIEAIHSKDCKKTASESLDLAVAAIWLQMTAEDYNR